MSTDTSRVREIWNAILRFLIEILTKSFFSFFFKLFYNYILFSKLLNSSIYALFYEIAHNINFFIHIYINLCIVHVYKAATKINIYFIKGKISFLQFFLRYFPPPLCTQFLSVRGFNWTNTAERYFHRETSNSSVIRRQESEYEDRTCCTTWALYYRCVV